VEPIDMRKVMARPERAAREGWSSGADDEYSHAIAGAIIETVTLT
jgi:hypothetical protein